LFDSRKHSLSTIFNPNENCNLYEKNFEKPSIGSTARINMKELLKMGDTSPMDLDDTLRLSINEKLGIVLKQSPDIRPSAKTYNHSSQSFITDNTIDALRLTDPSMANSKYL
jgi:hypothetical protein